MTTGRLIKCQAPPTGGSRFNLSRLAIGAFDFALAQSDWQYYAYHGTRPDDIKRFGNLRAVMSLHAEPLQIIVSESSTIAGFADLAGHRVGIGNPGSGQRGTMSVLMERYRMTLDDFAGRHALLPRAGLDVSAAAPAPPTDVDRDGGRDGGPRVGSSLLIFSALAVGIVVGLVFGEYCAPLTTVGDAFVGLLQMTVLAYIVFSLIANLGRLSLGESKRLLVIGLSVMVVLWVIGAALVVLMPQALPAFKTGAVFSTSLIDPLLEVDFLRLFVPSNPFRALASNFAPTVVVFCLFLGFALTHVANKEAMLGLLDVINSALARVNHYIVKLSPIGIFAIAASASGTITLEEFERMQAYLLIYVGGALFLTFWVLTMLVATFTPFGYRDVLRSSANV